MSKQPLNTKDLFKRLPFLAKNMKESEKKLIENYMSEKVRAMLGMFRCYHMSEKVRYLSGVFCYYSLPQVRKGQIPIRDVLLL